MLLIWPFTTTTMTLPAPRLLLLVLLLLVTTTHGLLSSSADLHQGSEVLRYFYSDEAAQQSLAGELPIEQQDELRRDIRRVLNLPARPKRSVAAHRPREAESALEYLQLLYAKLKMELEQTEGSFAGTDATGRAKRAHDEVGEADTIVTYKNQIRRMRKNQHLRHHPRRRFWFNVTEVPTDAEVLNVELRLYRDAKLSLLSTLNATEQPITLSLYALSPRFGDKLNVDMDLVHSYNLSNSFDGWLKFNVTVPFARWIRHPQDNLGLYLQIRQIGGTKDLSPKMLGIVNTQRGEKKYQPFMIAFTKNPHDSSRPLEEAIEEEENKHKQRRARRETRTRPKKRSDLSYYDHDRYNPYLSSGRNTEVTNCHKQHLFISFRELDWEDWIIQPHGYTAWYCSGECAFPLVNNSTGHAIMQTLMHVMNPHTVKKPCCAPSQLSPIMVLYFDDNSNVVLKKYSNMVVKSCGCH